MKKYRIKSAALLVCLVVSFTVFFSCGEHTDDISSVKFYCVSDTQKVVGIEGNSDIMSPICIFPTQCSGESFCPTVSFVVKDGMQIALTSLRYNNASSAPESSDANTKKGVVEKKQDGQWVFYSDIVYGGVSTMIPKKIPFAVESGQYTQPVCIPWYDPGEYRITYYFREFIEHEDGKFSTGEELFQVSHTLEVPPTDGNVLDIIAVGVSASELQDSVALAVTTTQLDEMPWLSCRDVDIQEWDGGGWSQNSSVSAHFTYPREYIRQNYVYPMLGVEHPERYATVPNIVCEGVDKEGSYRLTLHFCENEDGSGEQYELTLNVRFDEVQTVEIEGVDYSIPKEAVLNEGYKSPHSGIVYVDYTLGGVRVIDEYLPDGTVRTTTRDGNSIITNSNGVVESMQIPKVEHQ